MNPYTAMVARRPSIEIQIHTIEIIRSDFDVPVGYGIQESNQYGYLYFVTVINNLF